MTRVCISFSTFLLLGACGDDGPGPDPIDSGLDIDAETAIDAPSGLCCNAAEEPGVGGNPPCIEGASCCDDGTWQCNDGAGNPVCVGDVGQVCGANCCDPAEEPGVGGNPPCIEGASCCDDGTWQCNDGAGNPACIGDVGDICPMP